MSKVIQLEPGVWLADCLGDPPRTLVRENARRFICDAAALRALNLARRYHPFVNAVIEEDSK